RPGSQLRVRFGEWRAAGPPFSFWYWRTRSTREHVARMERSEIRGCPSGTTIPDGASLHPGYGRNVQRSANASLAPSAANPAAKLRRSQAIAFGRVMTRSRKEAANKP